MHASRWPVSTWVPIAALTALGACVRLVGLDGQSFWIDEIITAELLVRPFHDLLATVPHSESTPPLYYVLAWLWTRVAGVDEAGVRSLSAVLGTLTIPAAYAAARTLVSHRAGLIVAALAAVSPLLVWYSQEARAYSLFVLLGALSFLTFARALETPSPRQLGAWAAASSLMILTHYFGVFLLAAEAGVLLYRHRRRATVMAVGATVGVGVALLPLAVYQVLYSSSRWIRFVDLETRVEDTVRQLVVPSPPTIWAGAGVPEGYGLGWWPIGVAIVLASVAGVLVVGSRRERRGALISLGVALAAVGAPLVMALAAAIVTDGRGDVFLYRNVIAAWLPLAVVVGAALGARRAGIVGVAGACVLVVWSFAVVLDNATSPERQRDDWRLVARALGPPAGQVVVLSPSWQIAALERSVPNLEELGGGRTTTREIDLLVRRTVPSYSPAVASLRPPPGFIMLEPEEVQNWLLVRFRSPTEAYVDAGDLGIAPPDASFVSLLRAR